MSASLSTVVLNNRDQLGKVWLPDFYTSNTHFKTGLSETWED